ncbi:MAG TPA: heparinase, partial [Oceanospirillales bacterium]|nr:heparinase [Oceanospirillales bacterium]
MLFIKIRTAISLGMINLARVLIYRIGLKFGFNPVKTISAKIEKDFFFDGSRLNSKVRLPFNTDWLQQQKYFGWKVISSKDIPIWYKNVLTQKNVRTPFLSWWSIPDFDPELGDIKGVWEASRFDWVLCFAQQAATGDKQAIDKLNKWLSNWIENNKPYQGVNWKCGQEASIRIMHLAMASLILKNYFNTQISLLSLVKAHLQRIEPTISYAMAQDNNHG